MERRRVGDRVHAVEGVGEEDEPVLLADRRDRVGEGEAPRDLALQEETDHLALAVGLDLLARDHDQVAAPRLVQRLERAAEGVVVGDGDRAESLGLRVVDELGRVDRAVERPGGVHVEVGDDPGAVRERVVRAALRPAAARQAGIQGVELRGDGLERLAFCGCAGSVLLAFAKRVVPGQTRCRCRRQLGLEIDADRCRDRAPGSLRLEPEPRRARRAPG